MPASKKGLIEERRLQKRVGNGGRDKQQYLDEAEEEAAGQADHSLSDINPGGFVL